MICGSSALSGTPHRPPHPQHSQKPVSRTRRGKMLQAMTTDNMPDIEDRFIERFESFRESVEPHDNSQIGSATVACREQQHDEQHQGRISLDCGIETQIASSAKFACVPL